ncbi:hypothetical protein [uncultured Nostoc sp.]|uniref:hypothetical protein n=1 Tax=uncultured Nostoc sp. TaxID=340711 RepID=UPI0035CC081A
MTITIQQLIENLQQFPEASVVAVKDVDDVEFATTGFNPGVNEVIIVIGEKVDDGEEEES